MIQNLFRPILVAAAVASALFTTGAVAEDERRGAGGREDLPGHGGLEHGLLGRRFCGVGGGHRCMPASSRQLMAESICTWLVWETRRSLSRRFGRVRRVAEVGLVVEGRWRTHECMLRVYAGVLKISCLCCLCNQA